MKTKVSRLFTVTVALTLIPSAIASAPGVVGQASRSVVLVLARNAQGSAFAFGKAGDYLTNAHVVRGVNSVVLLSEKGRRFSAVVVARDDRTDVAELRSVVVLPALMAARVAPQPGDEVFAIGAASGFAGTVTRGIVSAVDRNVGGVHMIQTDAAVNPGSSGGVLLTAQGRVLGITTSLARDSQGIAFVVPIETAERSVASPAAVRAAEVKAAAGLSFVWLVGFGVFALVTFGAAMFLLKPVIAGRRRSSAFPEIVIRPGVVDALDPVVVVRRQRKRLAEGISTAELQERSSTRMED